MKSQKITLSKISYIPLLILFFSFHNLNLNAQQIAFPTAKGAGAYTTGGRGGQVIHVTTLDWEGPGSLKEAIQTPGPRTVVFDVSGEIDATIQGDFENIIYGSAYNDITIAGQTAPNGGISVRTTSFRFANVDNVIIRFMRFRNDIGQTNTDAIWLWGGHNTILDHCTFSHGADEGIDLSDSIGSMGNITVQNCFFQDSKTGLILGVDDVVGDFTMINNLFSGISHRFPNPKGDGHYDIINNVVYNWKNRLIRITGEGTYNVMNNYYKGAANGIHRPGWFVDYDVSPSFLQKLQTQPNDDPLIYAAGSQIYNQRTAQADDSDMWTIFNGSHLTVNDPVPSQYFTSSQFPLVGNNYAIKPADEAYNDILNNVGSDKTLNADGSINPYLDTKDAADILMVINDTYEGSFFDYTSDIPYPTVPQNIRPNNFYSSNPHIPELWFQVNVPEGENHNDIAPSGYTWLEEYLNGVDSTFVAIGVESVEVFPETEDLQLINTLQLTTVFTPSNATNTSGVWISSDESIATVDTNGLVTPVSLTGGVVTITFTTNDGGYTDTSQITVLPEALQVSAGTDQQICEGESTTLTASGGTSYVWSTGETTESIDVTPTETITYTVTVSDDNGQSEEANVIVTVNAVPAANAGEDQTICEGESITLTASGGDTYLWNTGETTASIEVIPTIETLYSVEVSTNNCASNDEVTVFVNTLPTISITQDLVIVEGESTTLTATGSDNYEWSTGEVTESITVTPTVTATYTVSTINVNGCSNNANVTVTVIPEVIANAGEDVTICSGETVTLTAEGGSTYTWDTSDLSSEIIVNPTLTTTYTVTAEDEYGYTNTDSVTVFVNDLPSINVSDDIFVMIGNSAVITASGGTTYSWNTGETTAEITVTPEFTTIYTVTGDSENGCENIAEVTVTVVELLEANAGEDSTICLGDSITLNASGGITFTWNTGDTGASPTFTPTETTTYNVTITDGFGNSDTDDVTITVNPIPTAYAGEDQTICQNESVTLTATAVDGDSYLWSTGETIQSITVNPNEDTIYTVEVSNNTCSHSDDVTVFVLPIPEITISDDIVIMLGNSTTLQASGGDSYLWSTSETAESIIVNPAETTTYTITGFIENGCENTAQVTVTVVPEVIANAGNDVSICFGESVTLNASGQGDFSWNTGDAGTSPTLSPTETTIYTVTATDNFGNSDSDSVTVTVNELPNLTVSDNITIFEGESTNLIADGAETYLWNTGETSNSIIVSPIGITTYSVTGFSASDCEVTEDVTVTVIPEVIANAGSDIDICAGESVTLNASGSTNYSWNTGQTSASITLSPTETTTYTVIVSDNFGNSDSDTVIVTVNQLPSLTISEDIIIFEGENTNLIVNGSETYLWNTGETSNSIIVSPIETTTYTATGFSLSGCQSSAEVTVTVIPEVIANAGSDITICDGESITLTASGSSNYLWNTNQTSASIAVSPSETTTYTITVSDNYGNSDSDSVTVTVNQLPNMTVSDNVTIFEGESTIISASGAENYLWNTDETTNSITVSPSETTNYIVTGESEFGCLIIEEITVIVLPAVNANAGNDVSICAGSNATLNATGGTSYVWNSGETTALITVSPTETTTYTVTAIDALGNSDTDSVTITVDEIPNITVSDDIIIFEGNSTNLTVNGANIYIWSTGQTSSAITVSPAQTTIYTVVGYSANICESEEQEITVTVIPEVNAFAGNDVTICNGESTTLIATGGFNYSWNTGQNNSTLTVTPTETTTYTVTVTDDFGNSDTDSVTVTVDELPNLTVSENITIFDGESTNLMADGAETYLWNTGGISSSIDVSPAETTTYSVSGFSTNGCETLAQITVTVIPEVIANAGNDVAICIGESVTLNASGGVSYIWNTGDTGTSPTLTPTATTTYTVTVSDNLGNSDTDSVTITVNELPNITVSENSTIFEGESINLNADGGETYLWSTGETSSSIDVSPLETTTYSATGFSTNGCETSAQVTVTVIPLVIANAGNDVSICIGESVTLNASGGSNFAWNTGQTSASITLSPAETATYTVTVSDNFGNSDTDSVTVTVNELPNLTVSENITIYEGESTNLIADGAETYLWNTGDTSGSINVSPIETTNYSVTGFTTSGCQITDAVTVTVIPEVVANAGNDVAICNGESVTLNASGGVSYFWNTGGTGASPTFTPTTTTTYTVTVSDNSGNSDTDSVTVTVNDLPTISVSENITIIEGESTSLLVNGATSYLWNTGETSNSIVVSPTQTTTYTVVGSTNSCSSTEAEIVVTVAPLFEASAGADERVCDNQTYNVVLTASQGDSYSWSTGETTQSIVVSPLSTTSFTVTVSSDDGQVDSDDVTVYIDPSPIVAISNGESVEILNGDYITLSASGANTYEWTNGATQPNIAVSPSVTTTYEVKGYIGECYDEKQITVIVLQPVIADAGEDVFICLNEITTLTATGGDEYVWSTGETTPTIQVSPLETTDYTVTVFNALDFDEATVRVEIDANCINQQEDPIDVPIDFIFNVYPNPASNVVYVKITGALNVSDVNIFDLTGKLVHRIKISNDNLSPITTTQIDISSLQTGVYFVKLIGEEKDITKKLIVK